jgi:hypothetical protein
MILFNRALLQRELIMAFCHGEEGFVGIGGGS